MPQFGVESLKALAECHPDLQRLFEEVVTHVDCKIIDGARTIEEQQKNVAKGVSKTMDSKHLPQSDGKSHAVDVVPYPQPSWVLVEKGLNAVKRADPTLQLCRFYHFVGFVAGMAAAKGIPLRQGVNWDGDADFGEHSFIDLPHHEIKESK